MGRVSLPNILGCFTRRSPCSCFCINSTECAPDNNEAETKPLVLADDDTRVMRLKDIISGNQTLGFQLKPKMVTLRVSMHCDGCAKRVEKHISKMDGVTSYKVDLESKMVIVIGDIIPIEVVESMSKVTFAELWNSSPANPSSS